MAKKGLTKTNIPNLVDLESTWALCVGSGISFPVFPMWDELAKRIVHKYVPAAETEFSNLRTKMTPDIIMQSAMEKAGISHHTLSLGLANTLYEDFFRGLSDEQLLLVKRCLVSDPATTRDIPWGDYIQIVIDKAGGHLTALSLAETTLRLREHNRAPSAILSFNAEMLFGSLLNALAFERYGIRNRFFDYLIGPISNHFKDRIPYYFCHGVMPVPGTSKMKHRFDAEDKLVFLENEYLQLANSSYSWQSSAFINTLSTHTVFFVGLSLADANIRRWLAWLQRERLFDIQRRTRRKCYASTSHYWIEKNPGNDEIMRMMESSVSHLGIRIIWIDDWRDVSYVIEKGIVV